MLSRERVMEASLRSRFSLFLLAAGICLAHSVRGDECSLPSFPDCFYHVLTVPANGTLSVYCIVEGLAADGPLHCSWRKADGNTSRHASIHERGNDYNKNVSVVMEAVQESDAGAYELLAANDCGESRAPLLLVVEEGSCVDYQYPNATHIQTPPGAMAYEGQDFRLQCLYNGDIDPVHFTVEWGKDDEKAINIFGPQGKYQTHRTPSDCTHGVPCCSFSDWLTVTNVTSRDSGLYSCVAAATVFGGNPFGANRTAFLVVAPFPSIVKPPSGVWANAGETVSLSCQVEGFANATGIVWKQSQVAIATNDSTYSIARVEEEEKLFVETLSFVASQELNGKYSCCVGFLKQSGVMGMAGGLECSATGGTVAVPSKTHSPFPFMPGGGQQLKHPLEQSEPSPVCCRAFLIHGLHPDDSVTFDLILDLMCVLETVGITCRLLDTSRGGNVTAVLEEGVNQSQFVLVVLSQTLCSALSQGGSAQTPAGYSSGDLLALMQRTPHKFISLSLSNTPPVSSLQGVRCYHVGSSLGPLVKMVESGALRTELLAKDPRSDLQQLIGFLLAN